ncbi:DNA-directed RNA polymerase subunit beta [Paenibacillus gorillae]|uniref:DNA-directed RNA polymerase subunit beta n=1 Tax=Paenibacillus gorillae TaxID=1243662 RepID=UPI0004B944B7|nr:DNA-directed RNA polymerase subunit beta [Paenibacillus gorillae]
MSMAEERTELSRRAAASKETERSRDNDSGKTAEEWPADEGKQRKQRSTGARITLWLLRKSIVPIIMVIMLVAGLYIGYTVLGKQPGDEVFSWGTWQHMYDLVFSDT